MGKGWKSIFLKHYLILRVHKKDQILYQIVNEPHFSQRFKTVTNEKMETFFESKQANRQKEKRHAEWNFFKVNVFAAN